LATFPENKTNDVMSGLGKRRFELGLVIGDGRQDRLDVTPTDEVEVINSLLDRIER